MRLLLQKYCLTKQLCKNYYKIDLELTLTLLFNQLFNKFEIWKQVPRRSSRWQMSKPKSCWPIQKVKLTKKLFSKFKSTKILSKVLVFVSNITNNTWKITKSTIKVSNHILVSKRKKVKLNLKIPIRKRKKTLIRSWLIRFLENFHQVILMTNKYKNWVLLRTSILMFSLYFWISSQ